MNRIKFITTSILIIFLICISYFNVVKGPFLFDDIPNIVNNRYIKNIKEIKSFVKLFSVNAQHLDTQYRPISDLFSAIDYHIWKENPAGFHITNIILHILNSIFIYIVINMFWKNKAEIYNSEQSLFLKNYLLFFVPIYFAINPIVTETVSYITNREELLSLLFILLGIFMWLNAVRYTIRSSKGKLFIILSSLSYLLGIFSKENAVVMPVLIISYGVLFLDVKGRRTPLDWGMHYYILPLLIGIIPSFIFKYMGFQRLYIYSSGEIPEGLKHFYAVISTYIYYIKMAILPVNQNVDIHFIAYPPLVNIAALIIFIGVSYLFIYKNMKNILFLWLWFIISLLPVSNIFYMETREIAEQRLYTPSLALAFIFPVVIYKVIKNKKIIYASNICLISIFILLIINRNIVWTDPVKLWGDAVTKSPGKGRTHFNYASALFEKNLQDEALKEFKIAVDIEPRSDAYNNIGSIMASKGDLRNALSAYKSAVSIQPDNITSLINIGFLYIKLQEYDLALIFFQKALGIAPDSWSAFKGAGMSYIEKGMGKDGIDYLLRAVKIKDDKLTWYYLAKGYEMTNDYEKGIDAYNRAEGDISFMMDIYYRRGSIYLETGDPDKAIDDLSRFVRLMPSSVPGLNNLANALVMKGRIEEGISYYKKALEYEPEDSVILSNLGRAYIKIGVYKKGDEVINR